MKVYISADIEGIAGICHWDEATIEKPGYDTFLDQMTGEVVAACTGAIASGATEIIVKDAHDSGRNLDPNELPEPVQLIRGWSGHPYSMVQEINSSFDALILVGYHSPSGSSSHPLAHTYSPELNQVLLNGQPISEFHLITMTAAHEGVPVVFVSGDYALCQLVKAYDSRIETVATSRGIGESVWGIHPQAAIKQIQAGVKRSLEKRDEIQIQPLPKHFQLELVYKHPPEAYKNSFYPGAKLKGEQSAILETTDWLDVMRGLLFMV